MVPLPIDTVAMSQELETTKSKVCSGTNRLASRLAELFALKADYPSQP